MQSEEIDRKLREAIERRMLVMFEYADLIRVVEPHRYGINSAGHPMLSGWLRAGYSRSDPAGGWRNYLLSDIHAFQRLDAPFIGARPRYAAHDARMREVFAELPATAMTPETSVRGPFVVREPGVAAPPDDRATATTPATPPAPHVEPAPSTVTEQAERAASRDAARTHDGEGEAPASN